MSANLPSLTALRAFHAAGGHLSFQDAARSLNVTPSAISHQIRALEDWLGTPLFIRGARRIELTRAGKDLLRVCDRSFAALSTAALRLRKGTRQTLRISALPLITTSWLIPRLSSFEAMHPGIALEIDTTNKVVNLDRDGCDVAIRNLRSPTPGLVSRKLLDVSGVPVCTRRIAARLASPADLANETIIHVSARPASWSKWLAQAGYPALKPRLNLSFDTVPAALDAAAQGHGVALGMQPLMWEAPCARTLVVPFKGQPASMSAYYVVHRRADGGRSDVAAFVSWLTTEMAAYKLEVHGRRPAISGADARPSRA
jgi:LysR family glycine cleavage system transcriptional activator